MIDHKDLSAMLETAIVAARLAGQRATEQINSTKVSVKNNNELVTQADALCQDIIVNTIKQKYPDHGFIAEEGSEGKIFKQSPRSEPKLWWVIDPIDGTNNFAHSMPIFTVSIAVMLDGFPIVGVVFEPATDQMFTAVKDGPVQLNTRHITASTDGMDQFSSIGLDSHFHEDVPNWARQVMMRTRYRNLGTTALHLAYVANGAFAAAIVNSPKLWDISAGALIASRAGAITSNWKGREIFPVDLDNYTGEHIECLAANKKIHPEIIQLING